MLERVCVGARGDRPHDSREFAVMLQAKTSSGLPIYSIQRAGAGHGMGNDLVRQTQNYADFATFFERELR
jgi:prolyl oligopeptidase PreP (S9A serine peptidase family)